ncbi:DNA-(apurinic or apyrimidinic site) lyase [Nymphaea thermarum]|nr:DNA-(apurinic or apyrimidinic site) lyase [Nymphaea thermarum]
MKRFFKPIVKAEDKDGNGVDGDGNCDGPLKKKQNQSEEANNDNEKEPAKLEPCKFMTWNSNSLLLRVKNNWVEFTSLVQRVDPDVIAIQEVRMPAAGSKGTPKNPGELKDDTNSAREEKRILLRALSSPPMGNYRVWWSLADSKYGGTALLIKKQFQPQKVSFSLDKSSSRHEPDGRVILAEFESFYILNTYVPNNGWKDEENSFQRRRKWDKRMLEFVIQLGKPLVWCGDLNVSHEDIDVSHKEFFSNARLNGYIPPNKEDCGQPGFTIAERQRFSKILREGRLLDAYRFLHKEQDFNCGFTWSGNPVGKYRGKRMRIDYFIVSEVLKDRIISCKIHGQGIELVGFCGSDHCPVSLELSPVLV